MGPDARLVTSPEPPETGAPAEPAVATRTPLDERVGRAARLVAPLLAGLVAFGVTRSTMLPGLDFWDTAEFQTVAPLLGTAHPTGYPTYILLGWLGNLLLGIPGAFGEPAARMNLLSGIYLGAAAGIVVWIVRLVGGRTLPALAAGILLALTPWTWKYGSFADPHTLHLVFIAAILFALAGWEVRRRAGEPSDRWLVIAAALFGLSMGNHQLTLLLAPGILLFLLVVDPAVLRDRRLVLRCAGALAGAAAAIYLLLPFRELTGAPLVYGHPASPLGFLYVASGVQFAGDIGGQGDLFARVGDLVGRTVSQFGLLSAFVPAGFAALAVRRPHLALLTAAWVLVTAIFASSYSNAAIDRYYLGPILCAVVWLGAGAAILVDAMLTLRASLAGRGRAPGAEPAEAPRRVRAATGSRSASPSSRAPSWSPRPSGRRPPTSRRSTSASAPQAAAWSSWVFTAAEPNAVIVSWWSFSTTLWYRQLVLGERADIRIVDDRDREDENLGSVDDVIAAYIATRPVYLIRDSVDLQDLQTRWSLAAVDDPQGIQSLLRVTGPAALHGPPAADTVRQ